MESPSGSDERVPFRTILVPGRMPVWSVPASAMGERFPRRTTRVTASYLTRGTKTGTGPLAACEPELGRVSCWAGDGEPQRPKRNPKPNRQEFLGPRKLSLKPISYVGLILSHSAGRM